MKDDKLHVIENASMYKVEFADGSHMTCGCRGTNVIELQGKQITVYSKKAGVPAHTYVADGKCISRIVVVCVDDWDYEIRA